MHFENLSSKTQTLVVYPISSALREAELYLDHFERIITTNDWQTEFIDYVHSICKNEVPHIKEIESIANTDNEKINDRLMKRGFQIRLGPFGSGGFGVASALDLLGEWAIKGKNWSVKTDDNEYYPGIKMTNYGKKFYKVKDSPNYIIEIETKENDLVYIMMADAVPEGLNLLYHVDRVQKEKHEVPFEYDGFIFPKIELDEEIVLDWIMGLQFDTPRGKEPFYVISQALQQTKLKMNEEGFRVKSAVALGILAGAAPVKKEPYIINKPFLMWITREGLSKPLFIAYLNKDVWKDPKNLNM